MNDESRLALRAVAVIALSFLAIKGCDRNLEVYSRPTNTVVWYVDGENKNMVASNLTASFYNFTDTAIAKQLSSMWSTGEPERYLPYYYSRFVSTNEALSYEIFMEASIRSAEVTNVFVSTNFLGTIQIGNRFWKMEDLQ